MAGECGGQPFIVAGHEADPGPPRQTTLHHPSARQQHETVVGLGIFYSLRLNAVGAPSCSLAASLLRPADTQANLSPLGPTIRDPLHPFFGVDCRMRLSEIIALGAVWGSASACSNRSKSAAGPSKQPARSQHWVCCWTMCQEAGRWASDAKDTSPPPPPVKDFPLGVLPAAGRQVLSRAGSGCVSPLGIACIAGIRFTG